jgi:hypothetical protein
MLTGALALMLLSYACGAKRCLGFGGLDRVRLEDVPTQVPGIPVSDMVDLSLNTGVRFGKADRACLVAIKVVLKKPGEVDGVAALQPTVSDASCAAFS